jgi:hypothetical protein
MGREVRRVPLDFDAPLKQVWPGFLMPESLHEEKCAGCDGSGYSAYARGQQARWYGYVPFDPSETGSERLTPDTPAVRAFAERNVTRNPEYYGTGESVIVAEARRLCSHWNGSWSHHLHQDDVDALIAGDRLWDFTHTLAGGNGWKRLEPCPPVTAEQVNTWSLTGFGHDGLNCMVVIRAACERAGESETCGDCDGHGSHERYPGQRAEAEAWKPTGPPAGDGWQLWETVSEGSPISPVFQSAEALARWMTRNKCTVDGPVRSFDAALKFVMDGWAPSFMSTPETGVVDGVTWVGSVATGESVRAEQ